MSEVCRIMKQKGIGTPVIMAIVAVIVGVVVISGVGLYVVSKGGVENQVSTTTTTIPTTTTTSTTSTTTISTVTHNHDPIHIYSDSQFTSANGVNGGGSGTQSDPYIIGNWIINATITNGIDIENTTSYFIIRNCLIENCGYPYSGIWLENVVNGTLDNNICSNNDTGIFLVSSFYDNLINNTCSSNTWNICLMGSCNNTLSTNICLNSTNVGIYLNITSDYNTLTGNICDNNLAGIYLSGLIENPFTSYPSITSYNTLDNNTCNNNGYGIYLYYSNSNILTNNICLNNTQYGIYIDANSNNNTLTNNYLLGNTTPYFDAGTNNSWS